MSAIEAAIATACEVRDRYAVLLERVDNGEIDFSAILSSSRVEEGEDDYDIRAVVVTRERERIIRSLTRKWRAEYREIVDIRLPRLRLQHNQAHAALIRLVAGGGGALEP